MQKSMKVVLVIFGIVYFTIVVQAFIYATYQNQILALVGVYF